MDLKVILTSTVIATIFASAISFYNNHKNNRLSYITNDRKEWREEIRAISVEIVNADILGIKVCLTKLKVHLNAYGNVYHSNSIFEDAHIWRTIERLEAPINKEEFDYDKSLLVDFLSLLLKFDWERSKEEITGNKSNLIAIILWISGIVLFTYFYFINWALNFSIHYITLIGFSLVLYNITPNYIYNNLLKEQQKSANELLMKDVTKSICFDFGFMLVTTAVIYFPVVIYFLGTINQNINLLLAEMLIVFLFVLKATLVLISEKKKAFYNRKYYFFSIKYLIEERNKHNFKEGIYLNNSSFHF